MEKLYKLKARLMDVLENDWADQILRKPAIGMGDIELIHKLTDTIKNIDKICMLEEGGGYSGTPGGSDYPMGVSHATRGEHWVRGHYSRDDGRTAMMEHLEAALNSASEQDRENIKRFMREMDRV